MASGATGHRGNTAPRRPPTRSIHTVGTDDDGIERNTDAVGDAVGDIPTFPYTEIVPVEDGIGAAGTITFTGSTLDQTLPHKLTGRHVGVLTSLPSASATFYSPALPSDSKFYNTHFRIVASAACTVPVWVYR